MFALLLRSTNRRRVCLPFRRYAAATPAPGKKDPITSNAGSASFVEQQYNKWLVNTDSVHPSWHLYFCADPFYSKGLATNAKSASPDGGGASSGKSPCGAAAASSGGSSSGGNVELHNNVQATIRDYQQRGHLNAALDPLGIIQHPVSNDFGVQRRAGAEVTPNFLTMFKASDMEESVQLPSNTFIGGDQKTMVLKDLIARLEAVYCGTIGLEYTFISDLTQVEWLKQQFETPGAMDFTKEQKILTLERLTRATGFEQFLMKKYPSEKRFGLEGCEMLIPALKQIIDVASSLGVDSVVMGMAHRGRLNTLANVCRKPLHSLLTQFSGLEATDSGSGDVKYHLGTYIERLNRVSQRNIRLALIANPSHLEAVDPVVVGRIKAEQFYRGDTSGKTCMPILIHGDASNVGQGIVYEVLHLSDLQRYKTGGTIHIVANNQIGFTTDPRFSRSSRYCTDVQKVVDGPIFHVNADDPEAVIHVCNVAAKFRMKFQRDIVIDLIGYRRMGHNEIDEPMFTQPLMYQRIKQLKTCWQLYVEKLTAAGLVTAEDVQKIGDSYEKICNDAYDLASKEKSMMYKDWIDSPWPAFFSGRDQDTIPKTGVPEDTLRHIGHKFSSMPETMGDFAVHKGLQRVLEARRKMVDERIADWSLGEAFAFGSLLKEGTHVRLSGQDVERGTFSHRHHVIHDQNVDKQVFCQICHLYPDQAKYSVCNSSLSESAVLGFELGYAMANPNSLVMWEGQFGDFCNNAQVIIDQFIASGEAKWVRQAGVVMLLPHGMEGMGPEHSSCRPERFLQLCDDDPDELGDINEPNFAHKQLQQINIIVANCSTPANLFHIFRRQVHMPFRKPLILATPKSLLRLPACRSSFDEMVDCTEFRRLIPEPTDIQCSAKLLLFCTGKTYYDLVAARAERGKDAEVAICRVEQICPFPYDLFAEVVKSYDKVQIAWAQEEHKNQGWWYYVQRRMTAASGGRCIEYFGRKTAAAPSTGSKHQHYAEVEAYYSSIFGPAPPKPKEEPKSKDTCQVGKKGKPGDAVQTDETGKTGETIKTGENQTNGDPDKSGEKPT